VGVGVSDEPLAFGDGDELNEGLDVAVLEAIGLFEGCAGAARIGAFGAAEEVVELGEVFRGGVDGGLETPCARSLLGGLTNAPDAEAAEFELVARELPEGFQGRELWRWARGRWASRHEGEALREESLCIDDADLELGGLAAMARPEHERVTASPELDRLGMLKRAERALAVPREELLAVEPGRAGTVRAHEQQG
jgi:hypothetical protein